MTVSTTTSGDSVMPWEGDDGWANAGLEDVGATDVVLPRLRIQHGDGLFKDNLSGATYDKLQVIILGMVKQRIMWDDDVEDGQKPQCKSPDFVHGFPNTRENAKPEEQFPWGDSNFTPANMQVVEIEPQIDRQFPDGWSSNGYGVLPCSSCAFAQWGKDSRGKNQPPRCTEQHNYIVNYSGDEGATWTTALLSIQKTGIKPSKSYISSFAQRKQPMFTVVTELTLEMEKRGNVTYSVPKFRTIGESDRSHWHEYYETQGSIRSFIRSAPRRSDDDGESAPPAPSNNENTAPQAAPASAPAAPVAQPAPQAPPAAAQPAPQPAPAAPVAASPVDDDDDLPF